ncbi:hypothetical protein [Streptomyces sp. NPDC021969]|uniref:hypothetical protein n=1 Tax=unclassified Streptomyces TaxID=2593676 RepID=UPI0033D320C6
MSERWNACGYRLGGLTRFRATATFVYSRTDTTVGELAVAKTEEYVTGSYRFLTLEKTSHWQPQQDPDTVAAEILARVRAYRQTH